GAEKYADLSPGWERPPEPPHPRALKLLVGWCIKCACLNMAGVHPLVENIDRLPLARAIDTGNDDDYREIGLLEIELGIEQRLPQLGHLLPVPLLVDFVPELRRLKHRLPPHVNCFQLYQKFSFEIGHDHIV